MSVRDSRDILNQGMIIKLKNLIDVRLDEAYLQDDGKARLKALRTINEARFSIFLQQK